MPVGTTVYRWGDSFGGEAGMRIIKAGVMDDVDLINNTKPGAELYASERIRWVAAVEGANQMDGVCDSGCREGSDAVLC